MGGCTAHVPWKVLSDPIEIHRYIDRQYLLEGFVFKAQVSHFTRSQLDCVLMFWRNCQVTLGAAKSFRFSYVRAKASSLHSGNTETHYLDEDHSLSDNTGVATFLTHVGGDIGQRLANLHVSEEGRHLVGVGEHASNSDIEMDESGSALPGAKQPPESSRPQAAPLSIQLRDARRGTKRWPTESKTQKPQHKKLKKKQSRARFVEATSDEDRLDGEASSSDAVSEERETVGATKGKGRHVVISDKESDGRCLSPAAPSLRVSKPKPKPRPRSSKVQTAEEKENSLGRRPSSGRLKPGQPGYYAQLNQFGKHG